MKTFCWISLLCVVTDLTIARSEHPRTAGYTDDGFYPDEPRRKGTVTKLIEHNAGPEAEECVDASGKVYKLF